MGDEPGDVAETVVLPASRAALGHGAYLLVIVEESTAKHALPSEGLFTIGRDPNASLRVDHASVSRRHAQIKIKHGELRVSDLESRNGTKVNGVPLTGSRVLLTGDVIAVGEVLLVVHAELERALSPVILDGPSWWRRLIEETGRATSYGRSLAVLAIEHAVAPIGGVLRSIDVVGQASSGGLLALLPEADPVTARRLAEAVSAALRAGEPAVRVGLATCPLDATDPDSLVLLARAAAGAAPPGGVAVAGAAVRRIALGDREVLICHPAMITVFETLMRLARAELPVLIEGETGVGKENAAFALHHYSARRDKPFRTLNCAALPENLVESQLFGHARGAFTGALAAHTGLFEDVAGGTLFLDEIGELALPAQAKLLRAIETKQITRVGETREREVDFRIVAATNRVLANEVKAQRFREDLYHRLGKAHIDLLPLRERRCEIPVLFREFIAQRARRAQRAVPAPQPQVSQRLLAYAWPGNVRELQSVADYVMATVEDDRIELDDLPRELRPPAPAAAPPPAASEHHGPMRRLADELQELEQRRMTEALERCNGVKTKAAAMIDMPIRTFNMKFKHYGL